MEINKCKKKKREPKIINFNDYVFRSKNLYNPIFLIDDEKVKFYMLTFKGGGVGYYGLIDNLVWVIEKKNNLKYYNYFKKRLERKGNYYTYNGYYHIKYKSKKLNNDYENYDYSSEFLDILNSYNETLNKWLAISNDSSLIGTPKKLVYEKMHNNLMNEFYGDGYGTPHFKLCVFNFINKHSFHTLFLCFSGWIERQIRKWDENEPLFSKGGLDTLNYFLIEILYILNTIKKKIYLDNKEIEHYEILKKVMNYEIDISKLDWQRESINNYVNENIEKHINNMWYWLPTRKE